MRKSLLLPVFCLLFSSCRENTPSTSHTINSSTQNTDTSSTSVKKTDSTSTVVQKKRLKEVLNLYREDKRFIVDVDSPRFYETITYSKNAVYLFAASQTDDTVYTDKGYGETKSGIFSFLKKKDGSIKATSKYLVGENNRFLRGLYTSSLVPSLETVDIDAIKATEEDDTYSITPDTFLMLYYMAGIYDSSQDLSDFLKNVSYLKLNIKDGYVLEFQTEVYKTPFTINFTSLGDDTLPEFDAYVNNGGGEDDTEAKMKNLLKDYSYRCYQYKEDSDGEKELYATEYYTKDYMYISYATESEATQSIGYIGLDSSSGYISGIHKFYIDGNSLNIEKTPMDTTTNSLIDYTTYPTDFMAIEQFSSFSYNQTNDMYVLYANENQNVTLETCTVLGLEDYVNTLYPYGTGIRFKENRNDESKSSIEVIYIFQNMADGSLGTYSKTFTDFGKGGNPKVDSLLENLKSGSDSK